jgi:hypothetical protein
MDLICNKAATYWYLQPNTSNTSLGNYLSPVMPASFPIELDSTQSAYSVCHVLSLNSGDNGASAFQAVGYLNTGACYFDVFTYGK